MIKFFNRRRSASTLKTVQIRGRDIAYVPGSDIEEYRFSTYEQKEPETLDWIDEFVKDGEVFFDIGANIGIYSLYASTKVGSGGRVFSFEPECSNFVSLSRNIMVNNFGHNITTAPFALCESVKVDWFYLSGRDFFTGQETQSKRPWEKYRSGSAMHSFGNESSDVAAFHKYACLGVSLDWLICQDIFVQPNHIKLDVDGTELSIVKGGLKAFQSLALKSILAEINEGDEEIVSLLAECGFQKQHLQCSGSNCLFTRK